MEDARGPLRIGTGSALGGFAENRRCVSHGPNKDRTRTEQKPNKGVSARTARLCRPASTGISGNDSIGTALDAANNISLPEPLPAEIQSAARAGHRSVDEVLIDTVKRYVEERSWTKLLVYGEERAKALSVKESDIDRLIAESRAEQRGH